MALSIETLAVAKKYTDDSIAGGGAIKGKNCVITSIASITGGHRVTFQWTLDNGTVQTDTMDVMDGADGQDGATGATGPAGVGIKKIEKTGTSGLVDTYTITYTNDQTQTYEVTNGANGQDGQDGQDGEGVPTGGSQGQVLAKKSATDYDTEWVTPSAGATIDSELSTTSENPVQNKVITAALGNKVDAVPGKGLSTEDFSSEDKTKLSGIASGAEVNVQSDWDQSNNNADDFIKNKPTLGTAAAKDSTNAVTENSTDLVESGAVHTAIDNAVKALDVSDSAVAGSYVTQVTETDGKISVTREAADAAPAENSNKLVKSGGVYAGLAGKADKVSGATNGNFAGLNASGNLTDSGKKASDFALAGGLTDEIKKRFVNNCKNVLPIRLKSQTARGVTFTRNENDSFSLSGTCTGNPLTIDLFSASVYTNTGDSSAFKIEKGIVIDKTKPYILTRGDTQIRFTLALYQDGVSVATVGFDSTGGNPFMEIDFSSYTFNEIKAVVRFGNNTSYNNKTFIPMLCLKSDYQVDSGQQYYTKTNKQLTDETVGWDNFSELGAVNYIYPNEGSSTKSGVLYTLNDDNSCTLSGTAEGGGGFQWVSYNGENLVGKELTLNAGNDAVYSDMYFAFICRATLGGENLLRHDVYLNKLNRTDTLTVPAGTKVILCGFNIPASYTGAVSMTLKPILALSSYNGPYVPHAKTNKELTDDVAEIQSDVAGKLNTYVLDSGTSISLFDIITNNTLYPVKSLIIASVTGVTNGSDTLASLLSVNPSAHLKIFKQSPWTCDIMIFDTNGDFAVAYGSQNVTAMKFLKMTSSGNSVITVNKVTS